MTDDELFRRRELFLKHIGFIVHEWVTSYAGDPRGFFNVRLYQAIKNTGWSEKYLDIAIEDGIISETCTGDTSYLRLTLFGRDVFRPLLSLYGHYNFNSTIWDSEKS